MNPWRLVAILALVLAFTLGTVLVLQGCKNGPATRSRGEVVAADTADFRDDLCDFTEPDLTVTSTGHVFVAWLSYDGQADSILAATRDDDGWSTPFDVTTAPGRCFSPRLAADLDGGVWLVWSAARDGQHDLFARHWCAGQWSDVERLTEHPGPDTGPAVTMDRAGNLWVVWEAFRDGRFDLFARVRSPEGWRAERRLTDHPASDVHATIACDPGGDVWVAWMSWRDGCFGDGNYEIYARRADMPLDDPPTRVSTSPQVDMLPDLVPLADGLALSWTNAYFRPRTIETLTVPNYDNWDDKIYQVAWLRGGRWTAPVDVRLTLHDEREQVVSDYASAVAGTLSDEIWLLYGFISVRGTSDSTWRTELCRVTPDAAGPSFDISESISGPGRSIGTAWAQGQLWTAEAAEYQGDLQPQAIMEDGTVIWGPDAVAELRQRDPATERNWIHVRALRPASLTAGRPLPERPPAPRHPVPEDLASQQITRKPRLTVSHSDQTWTVFYGNLHYHTDYSRDGRRRDGPAIQNLRSAYDVARLDFVSLTDHAEWMRAGEWWMLRKLTDLWNRPGDFVALPGYEWTSMVHGHKNVIFPDTHVAGPDSLHRAIAETPPTQLWEHLGERDAITIPHHPSHAIMRPTDWSFHDERYQRLVEVFQMRGNYEYDGAPLQHARQRFAFAPGHCVRDALGLGHKLGIIASPDHAGGLGLAGVWAERLETHAIFHALYERRCFGTTGAHMALYLEVNNAPMGSEIVSQGPVHLRARIHGTTPGLKITVVSDGTDVHSVSTADAVALLEWSDPRPLTATRYYYIRAEQTDSHIGWTSPVWVSPP
jgi:hypothetical protein